MAILNQEIAHEWADKRCGGKKIELWTGRVSVGAKDTNDAKTVIQRRRKQGDRRTRSGEAVSQHGSPKGDSINNFEQRDKKIGEGSAKKQKPRRGRGPN